MCFFGGQTWPKSGHLYDLKRAVTGLYGTASSPPSQPSHMKMVVVHVHSEEEFVLVLFMSPVRDLYIFL